MMMRWLVPFLLLTQPALADAVATNRVIKPGMVITPDDLTSIAADFPGALSDPALVAGREARVALYPGRAIHADQIGAPATIGRNQIVTLVYRAQGLSIVTEGRALSRGGPGDMVLVLNLSSRNTVQGQILPDGTTVRVGPTEG